MSKSKKALPKAEWRKRLKLFAEGDLIFHTGQHPPKKSHWAGEIAKIKQCPRQSGSTRDGLGRTIGCMCGYHKDKVPVGIG